MRERKYVKFRVAMYDDTKFKIIDMKPERDLIHYIWTRFVTLAGKVDLEGDLYISKNIPYTIETLAIEFNRYTDQIKLALDVLIELEMIELTEDNIYRVKNFAKHQNIKVKEKIKVTDKEEDIKNKEFQVKENFKNEIYNNEDKELENKIRESKDENATNDEMSNLELTHKNVNKIDNNMSDQKINDNSQGSNPILLETKRNKTANKNKKKEWNIDEDVEDNSIVCFYDADEERPLGVGERVVGEWSYIWYLKEWIYS